MELKYAIVGMLAELIRIIVTITRPFSDSFLNFVYGIFIGTRKLPPITNKILLMPAVELAEKIRKKHISCEEVMKAYVERAKAVHPCINAAVDERYEEALKDAKNVDAFLATGAKTEEQIAADTPLLGLPFTCKEAIGVKGMAQTSGLVREKDHKAKQDGASAALYRKAGAIPVTVTDVPELCMWWESSNHVFGLTRNPYDNRRTVGGSSGGEGSIITSAGALFGIGNDIAGSIRIPASFCGIYGHKPSRGIVPNFGTYPFCEMRHPTQDRSVDFVSTGPMCRYAEDIPLLLNVLSDNDPRIHLEQKVDFKKMKVYYLEEMPGFLNAAIPEVKFAIMEAVDHFKEEYGITPMPLKLDELEYAFPIWESKLLEYNSPSFKYYLQGDGPEICLWWELVKNLFCNSDHTMPAIYFGMVDRRCKDAFYEKCLQKYQKIEKTIYDLFKDGDAILLVPTHPEPPPHYLMTIPKYPNIAYTCIFNILGLPSTTIPAELTPDKLPIGIQAVSGMFQDHLSVATALELDKVFKGWKSPCAISV